MEFNNSEDNYLYFNSPNDTNYGFLSIDYKSTIIINNQKFNSVRHFYNYNKNINKNNNNWSKIEYNVLYEANLYKFSQNPDLFEKLLDTNKKFLCFASLDNILGIGLTKETAIKTAIDEWNGSNLLGISLMDIRQKFYNSLLQS